jgi:hypothetical protein
MKACTPAPLSRAPAPGGADPLGSARARRSGPRCGWRRSLSPYLSAAAPASCPPVPPGPWSANASSEWKPTVRFHVGVAPSFSQCASTIAASRSTTIGPSELIGAELPDPLAGLSAGLPHRRQGGRCVHGQRGDQSGNSRVRRNLPEQVRLRPHHGPALACGAGALEAAGRVRGRDVIKRTTSRPSLSRACGVRAALAA